MEIEGNDLHMQLTIKKIQRGRRLGERRKKKLLMTLYVSVIKTVNKKYTRKFKSEREREKTDKNMHIDKDTHLCTKTLHSMAFSK